MELRTYQLKALLEIEQAWIQGHQNVLYQLPTGGGKTTVFCKGIERWELPTVINAHRLEIVAQISLCLARLAIPHNIIGQKSLIKEIIGLHYQELNKVYVKTNSNIVVSCIDTLLKLNPSDPLFTQTKLLIQDEAHHTLRNNKWGKVTTLFKNAKGLYVTATPNRADGRGLGRQYDGVIDALITGPTIRELINQGYLSPYKIVAPSNPIDLSQLKISAATHDYSLPGLRDAVHNSRIVGNVVDNYLQFASGKIGITFAVDVESATDIAHCYRKKGVSAEIISAKTPLLLRADIMQRFRNREILQLINVDILGEGVDIPAVEVISMARPTQSFPLYCQQFGRALRIMLGKTHALIIDHVDNVLRHNLPERPTSFWTLESLEKRARSVKETIPLTTCKNPACLACYERVKNQCPYCQFKPVVMSKGLPQQVDGNLSEYSDSVMEDLLKKIYHIESPAPYYSTLSTIAQLSFEKKHNERQKAHYFLKETMALFMGYCASLNDTKEEAWKRFYFLFNVDILTAQTLGRSKADDLSQKIIDYLKRFQIQCDTQGETKDRGKIISMAEKMEYPN